MAESSSDNVVPLAAEFFHVGRSSRMPRCSFENDTPPTERDDVDALRFDRGVDGAVDVRVDNDAFEPDGVSGVERSDDGVDGGCCFFKDERAGGGGRDMAGAEPLRACMGRVVRVRDVTLRGVSGVSDCRVRVWYALDDEPKCGVRDICKPMAICSTVGLVARESWKLYGDGDGGRLSTGVECMPAS